MTELESETTGTYRTPPPENFVVPRPPGPGALVLFTLAFMMIQVIFMVLAAVFGVLFPILPTTLIMLGAGLVSTLLWGGAAWFWVTARALPRSWLSLAIPRAPFRLWPLLLLTVPTVVVFGSNLDMLVFHAFPFLNKPDTTMEALTEAAFQSPLTLLLVVGLAVVAAPVCEELFFRGIVFRSLRMRTWTFLPAMLFTSALFAAIHLKLAGFFLLFIVAVVLAVLSETYASLLPAVLFHALYNSFVLMISLGSRWLTGPEMKPFSLTPAPPSTPTELPPLVTSLVLLLLSGPALAGLLYLIRRARPAPESTP